MCYDKMMDLEISVTWSVQCLYGILLFQFRMGRVESPLFMEGLKVNIIQGAEDGRIKDIQLHHCQIFQEDCKLGVEVLWGCSEEPCEVASLECTAGMKCSEFLILPSCFQKGQAPILEGRWHSWHEMNRNSWYLCCYPLFKALILCLSLLLWRDWSAVIC